MSDPHYTSSPRNSPGALRTRKAHARCSTAAATGKRDSFVVRDGNLRHSISQQKDSLRNLIKSNSEEILTGSLSGSSILNESVSALLHASSVNNKSSRSSSAWMMNHSASLQDSFSVGKSFSKPHHKMGDSMRDSQTTARMSDYSRFDEDDYEGEPSTSTFAESFYNFEGASSLLIGDDNSSHNSFGASGLTARDSDVAVGVGICLDDLPEVQVAPPGPSASHQQQSEETPMMEVSPGVILPLRGSSETWEAIKEGRITVTSCAICSTDLHVIEDAKYVVCPDCWIVQTVCNDMVGGILLECDEIESHYQDKEECTYGVGLGVKATDVVDWLNDIPEEENAYAKYK